MPSLQQLRYLVALSETLHFRRAAEACRVTQPTLSAQLRALESKLGAALVERGRSGVIVTPMGEAVAERARRVLREVEEIRQITRAGQTLLSATVRIGVVHSLSHMLPLIVPDLHARHPRLKLYLREGLPDMLLETLRTGALDVVFFPLPQAGSDLETLSLFREPILVVAPHDHTLAALPDIDPGMLRGETILAMEPGHKLYDQVRTLCDDYGALLSHDFAGTSLDTIRQMVAMGMGLSLMPALYVASEAAHQDIVVARRFRGAAPSRTVGMIWRRGTARQPEYRELARLIGTILRSRAPGVMVLG